MQAAFVVGSPPGGKGLDQSVPHDDAMTGVVPHDRGHPKSISEVPCLKLKFIHEIFKHEYLGTTPPTAVPVTFLQDYSIFRIRESKKLTLNL